MTFQFSQPSFVSEEHLADPIRKAITVARHYSESINCFFEGYCLAKGTNENQLSEYLDFEEDTRNFFLQILKNENVRICFTEMQQSAILVDYQPILYTPIDHTDMCERRDNFHEACEILNKILD